MPALGRLVTDTNRRNTSSHNEFNIPLCDLLLDLVEPDKDGPDALLFTEIAHSFANDVLHVSTLASALLWYEGVTPDLSRSTDLPSIAVNVEASLAFLRSACDVLATAFARFAVPAAKGRISKRGRESFHGLLRWVGLGYPPPENQSQAIQAKANYELVSVPFHFLEQHSGWFLHLRSLRNDLTHRGYYLVPYTERVFLEGILQPPGIAELQWLHGGYKQKDYREDDPPRLKRYDLLATIRQFTEKTIELANGLAAAMIQELGIVPSGTHFIGGVHVPALYHLLSYEKPTVGREVRGYEDSNLRSEAWYLLRAGDYLSAHDEGYPDGYWWRFKTRLSAICGRPPLRLSNDQSLSAAGRWYVFCCEGKHYGVVIHEWLSSDHAWIQDAELRLQKFKDDKHLDGTVLVGRGWLNETEVVGADSLGRRKSLIAEHDPVTAAEEVFTRLTTLVSPTETCKWSDDPHERQDVPVAEDLETVKQAGGAVLIGKSHRSL